MAETSFLVGSVQLEASGIEVNGVNVPTAAGAYYLRSANAALSLVDYIQGRIQTEVATATLFITEGRRVRLLPQVGDPVAIDWLANTTLRDLLGFTGNLASSDAPRTATNCSPLLWSPGWIATPATLLGTAGHIITDQTRHVSADGTRALVSTYYTQVQQELAWTHILAERLRVDAATNGGGTFHELYEQVLKLGKSCRWYVEQNEVDGSTTAITWDDSSTNSFGPYVLREANPRWYQRVVEYADLYGSLALPLMQVTEYS
jgi:hypothetical protein